MATGNVNNRSQMKNIRFPHDVLEQLEAVKNENETVAGFVVAAVRGEIVRRQMGGGAEDAVMSMSHALVTIREDLVKAVKIIDKEIGE
ncbi:hypothetical protein LWO97_003601 [Salmonella enterica subsp. enterica serovar Enteritidis]|nr:hypothetical protein [Salmonella enterica]EFR3848428.1 hypothetical protein [Salmonella enterica]EGC2275115.1 hypothetical protein [Salmonella enterica subsp. enterica serovar Agbeni]EIR2645994.1 hypothetical protein [Salmonella enterica subsp. enterica serovar Enteritidis]